MMLAPISITLWDADGPLERDVCSTVDDALRSLQAFIRRGRGTTQRHAITVATDGPLPHPLAAVVARSCDVERVFP